MNEEEIRSKAKWLKCFYQGVVDGGTPQFFGSNGDRHEWMVSYHGPHLSSNQDFWRVVYPPRKFWLNCGTMEYTGKDEVVAAWKEKGYAIIEAVEVTTE